MPATLDYVQSVWIEIRAQLASNKVRINKAITCYPTPIAGCDQQFNYLLEQQREISAEWARLNEAENESLTAADPIRAVDEFIRTSICLDARAKESLRRFMEPVAPRLQLRPHRSLPPH